MMDCMHMYWGREGYKHGCRKEGIRGFRIRERRSVEREVARWTISGR